MNARRRSHFTRASIAGVSLGVSAVASLAAEELIPIRSSWRYMDDGVNRYTQIPPFHSPLYDDASWKTGTGRLGYGGDGESTLVLFGSSATNKYITTYFRREFTWNGTIPVDADTLLLECSRDDGAMIYLNGSLVDRSNMPSGTVGNATRATAAISDNDEWRLVQTHLDSKALVPGRNVVAVAVHQAAPDSSDLGLDLRMDLSRKDLFFSHTELIPVPHQIETLLGLIDVTGDEVPELFTGYAVASDKRLQMRPNDGHGRFGPPIDIDNDFYQPSVLRKTNLDGDLQLDLLVATLNSTSEQEIRTYRGIGGSFVRTSALNAGNLSAVEVADLNSDGRDDIVDFGSNGSSAYLRWRRNTGNGIFQPPVTLLSDPQGAAPQPFVGITDANQDGRPDILASAPSGLKLFLNQGGADPSFVVTPVVPMLTNVRAVLAADLDRDGDSDFIAVNRLTASTTSGGLLHTFLNTGAGYAKQPVPLPVENGLVSPILQDLDQDGDPDLVFSSGDTGIMVSYENDGRGNWVHRRAYDSSLYTFKSSQLIVGDVDGDGQADVVNVSRTQYEPVTWFRNMRNTLPRIKSFTATPDTLGAPSNVVLAWEVENAASIKFSPEVPVAQTTQTATLRVERETTFTLTAENSVGAVQGSVTAFLANLAWAPAAAGPEVSYRRFGGAQLDINDDGMLDVAYVSFTAGTGQAGTYWAPMTANRSFGPPKLALLRAEVSAPESADLNGDGRRDLLTGIAWEGLRWLPVNDGGGFGPPRTVMDASPGAPLEKFTAADFDGDGDLDVATMQGERVNGAEIVRIFSNNGVGSFGVGPTLRPPPTFSNIRLLSMDLDGDGLSELVFLQSSSSPAYIAWNNGAGSFTQTVVNAARDRNIRFLHFADVNRDGFKDMFSIQTTLSGYGVGPEVYLELGRDDRLLGTRAGRLLFSVAGNDGFSSVATADVDKDGDPDLIVSREGSIPLYYALNNGDGGFSGLVIVTTSGIGSGGGHEVLAGDIDGDGDADAVTFYDRTVAAVFNSGPPPPVIRIASSSAMTEDGEEATIVINVSGLIRPQLLEFTLQASSTVAANEISPGPEGLVTALPGQPGKWSLMLQPNVAQVSITFRTPNDDEVEGMENALLQFSSPDPVNILEVPGQYGSLVTIGVRPSDFSFEGRAEPVLSDGVLYLHFSELHSHPHALEISQDLREWTVRETLEPLPDGTIDYLILPPFGARSFFRVRDLILMPSP